MTTIGRPAVRYYTWPQIQTFGRWELMQIIEENGWEELLLNNRWSDTPVEEIRVIINAKMQEPTQEVNHGPSKAH